MNPESFDHDDTEGAERQRLYQEDPETTEAIKKILNPDDMTPEEAIQKARESLKPKTEDAEPGDSA